MLKKTVAAALVAASLAAVGFAATAHASLFHSDPPASNPPPFSFKDYTYENGLTFKGKSDSVNPLTYEPSASLVGLRIGAPLLDQAPACVITGAPKPVNKPCSITDSFKGGAVVKGLPDPIEGDLVYGQAFVSTDASGRITAIVVPLTPVDSLARVATRGFLYRFGRGPSMTLGDTEAVWDLPSGAQAKLVYDYEDNVLPVFAEPNPKHVLYAAVYSKDAAPSLPQLVEDGWKAMARLSK